MSGGHLDNVGWTPLHAASQEGRLDIVRWLVEEKQVDPSCRDENGRTPLHAASFGGHLDIVRWLVDVKQVDPSCRDEKGRTPLYAASWKGHLDIVRWLIKEKQVDPSCQDEAGWTPLHAASWRSHLDIVRWLVDEKQVDPSCQDEKGWTPLHVASFGGHLDIVRWLVEEKQVDPVCRDSMRCTPLHMASWNGHLDIVRWLVEEKHTDPSCRDKQGRTSLDAACQNGHLDIVRWLADDGLHGVDIIAETNVSVSNEPQTFHWAGYGLKLHIPPASLPAGVGQSDIVIKASLAGQYQFPENTTLVSAVFWLRSLVKFTKPLTLEIQHCGKHSGTLSFVRAKCSQKDLPYQFKPLASPRGVFSSDCGSVTLFSFSGLGIVQEGSEEQQYCARLYYFGSRIDWRVHFVVIQDLETSITVRNFQLEH